MTIAIVTPPLFILGAFLLDHIIGDPLGRFHPVCLIGFLIDKLTSMAFKVCKSSLALKIAGLFIFLMVVGITYTGAYLFALMGWWAQLLLIYFSLSIKSLVKHLQEVLNPLLAGNLQSSRQAVGKVVGRDTDMLDEKEISRAGIETAAESFGDGIMAPLFFAAIGGGPLAMTYKAVNTLDSMIGYNFFPYKDIGYISAKLDDILNYIPARVSAIIFLLVGRLYGYNFKKGILTWKRDGAKHPSPNAGRVEAVMAGLLEVRLGGVNYYSGERSFRSYMGKKEKRPGPLQLKHSIEITKRAAWFGLGFSLILALIINIFFF